MAEKSQYSVQAVAKTIDLLNALAGKQDATLAVLADKLSLNRNKTYRLLSTLEEKGLVERDEVNHTYQLGVTAFEMAQHIMKCSSLIKIAHPVMEELAQKLGEAVYITVLSNDEVLFLDMVDSMQQVKAADLVGRRFPFFTNAAGKVIKSLSSTDFLSRGRRRRDIPDPEALENELLEIRRRGFAVDFNGVGDGLCAVAVAIRDYAGKVICSLTLLAPTFRMVQDRLDLDVIPSMLQGADALSSKFGYAPMTA
jgi:DNA-binding IclR family transcriptional regulator